MNNKIPTLEIARSYVRKKLALADSTVYAVKDFDELYGAINDLVAIADEIYAIREACEIYNNEKEDSVR